MTPGNRSPYNEAMKMPIVSTKLYIPPLRDESVLRPRLVERLNSGLRRKLTLISASTGFGKTTLAGEWLAGCGRPAAWLSLDESDNDPSRFLTYLIAAWQTIEKGIGEGALAMLHSPKPSIESIVALIINDFVSVRTNAILVMDDYHVIEAGPIHDAVSFLIERMPPNIHLVIATRRDPDFPLGRLRSRNEITEIRAPDLRFTYAEAESFLNRAMKLGLSSEQISMLEARTEGWIAGLQLAAISLNSHTDVSGFIESFSGSHRYVLDYLIEEVLSAQPAGIQRFLLQTSILDRLCGPLCDAVMKGGGLDAQPTLEYLERANLFLVPLDDERRWYRYHHLFADLLRQRLGSDPNRGGMSDQEGEALQDASELHLRASAWFEDNGFELEAFRHAAAAGDNERAAKLMEGGGMPLLFRGAVTEALQWLDSLPMRIVQETPSLSVLHASALLMIGHISVVEHKLQAAETALLGMPQDEKTRDLTGHIASIRATVAVSQHQADAIIEQSLRALDHLHPDNLPVRTAAVWSLGYAYQLKGDRGAAWKAYTEAIAISERIGHFIIRIMASLGLAALQELDNRLDLAEETYRRILQIVGDTPMPAISEAHLGLAKISFERNDIEASERHLKISMKHAQLLENTDRFIACELANARLQLAKGDLEGASSTAERAERFARRQSFDHQLPYIASVQADVLLRRGNSASAERLAREYELPLSMARARLAQGDAAGAIAVLELYCRELEAKGWENERLRAIVVLALAYDRLGETDHALHALAEALAMAETGGFIRLFTEEGAPMARLLSIASNRAVRPLYTGKLLAIFIAEGWKSDTDLSETQAPAKAANPLIEPLSMREQDVLRLIAEGLSNQEIGERLFLALSTVKGYNRNIFDKLQVQRRTEAVARARELGLL